MSKVIPEKTKIVRMVYTRNPWAYFDVDFGDIDLSQVKSVKTTNWCNLAVTMNDDTVHYIDTHEIKEMELDWKRGFEISAFLDEEYSELRNLELEASE